MTYLAHFLIGKGNTILTLPVEFCAKHDTLDQFEQDMEELAKRLGGSYLYKDESDKE